MIRLVAALGALAVIGFAAPAQSAEAQLVLSEPVVEASLSSLELMVTAEGLAADVGLDPSSVEVIVAGRALPTTATVADTSSSVSAPRVLLVVDTSGSMVGAPMAEAKSAITALASTLAPEVELGLMTFATAPRLVLEPTRDRTRLLGAVTAMQAQGNTALYDATLAAANALGGSGDRRLIVLSDGGDTASTSSVDDATQAVTRTGVSVDTIGFRTDEAVEGVLQQLTTAGRGTVHPAQNAAELANALTTTTTPLARALSLTVLLPEDVRGASELHVRVASPQGELVSSTTVQLGTASSAAAVDSSWWSTQQALLVGAASIGLSLLLGALALSGPGRDRRRVHQVLERYTTAPRPQAEDIRTASPVARTALQVAERVASSRDRKDRLAARLERAAVALTPAEWLLLQAGVAVALVLLLVLLGWNVLLAMLVGGVLGVLAPSAYLGRRGGKRQKAFEERLPDALQMVAGSLSAGYSLAQALDGVVREGSQPLATEFGKALAESRLGVPIETTLQGVADRMASRDFGWVVMAIRVQREVGGNLAGILTTVTATMRERAMLKRHVRALSAEGRLSAYILLGLPLFLALYMLTLRREYIEPMYTTGLGVALIVVAVVLMAVGSFAMSRMVKVEV